MERVLLISQLATIMTGLYCLRHRRPVILLPVLLLQVLVFINEEFFVPNVYSWWGISQNVCYTVYSFIDMLTWLYIFMKIFSGRSIIQIVTCISFGLMIGYNLFETFGSPGAAVFHTGPVMCFSFTLIALSYTWIEIQQRKDYYNLRDDPFFWVCIATISFHTVFFLNLITMSYPGYWKTPFTVTIFDFLQQCAILLNNLFICIAFILSRYRLAPPTKRT